MVKEDEEKDPKEPKEGKPEDKKDEFVPERDSDSLKRFLGTDKEEPKEKEDTPEEALEEEEKEKSKEEPKESEISPEEIAAEVKEEFKQKILKSLGISEKEEKGEEGEKVAPWVKENRAPKSYEEVAEWGAERAEDKRKAAEAEVQKRAEEVKEKTEEQYKQANTTWDEQLADLRQQKKIPVVAKEIQDKLKNGEGLSDNERKDPGLVAQRVLFESMYKISQQRVKQGKSPVMSLKEVYYEHYEPNKKKQPAGATAPVTGGDKSVQQETEGKGYEYKRDHGKSFHDILLEGTGA